jgi:hypothetical protein
VILEPGSQTLFGNLKTKLCFNQTRKNKKYKIFPKPLLNSRAVIFLFPNRVWEPGSRPELGPNQAQAHRNKWNQELKSQ